MGRSNHRHLRQHEPRSAARGPRAAAAAVQTGQIIRGHNNMKKLITILSALLITAFSVSIAAAQRSSRITFRRGGRSAVVSGTLNGYRGKRNYVIRVRPGQTLSTEQIGDRHDITIYIQSPSRQDVGDS